jgi:hypothetical protein
MFISLCVYSYFGVHTIYRVSRPQTNCHDQRIPDAMDRSPRAATPHHVSKMQSGSGKPWECLQQQVRVSSPYHTAPVDLWILNPDPTRKTSGNYHCGSRTTKVSTAISHNASLQSISTRSNFLTALEVHVFREVSH